MVYLLSHAAGDVTGRIFHVGGDAFLLYDTMRPLGGYRSPDGRWTAEAIAEVMPTLLAETTPPLDSREASRFLSEAPLP